MSILTTEGDVPIKKKDRKLENFNIAIPSQITHTHM
jgi:hypothetical protein